VVLDVCLWHIASFRCAAKLGRYWRYSGHCSALAHIANFGIFPAQSLKQGTKCRNSTTSIGFIGIAVRTSKRRRQPEPTHSLTGKPNIKARCRIDPICWINIFVTHHLNCGGALPTLKPCGLKRPRSSLGLFFEFTLWLVQNILL
jgi:hypothetical protein